MTDYIASGKVVPERIADIVGGIASGLRPSRLRPGRRRDGRAPRPARARRVRRGRRRDRGRRVRRAARPAPRPSRRRRCGARVQRPALQRLLAGPPRRRVRRLGADRHVDEFGRTLGEELLEPTRLYARTRLDLIAAGVDVHALSHVTGGGLAANLARVLPPAPWPRRPRHLDPAARLRRRPAASAASRGRPRAHPQPRRRLVARRAAGRRTPRGARARRSRRLPAWLLGEVRAADGARQHRHDRRRRWSAAPKGSMEERFRCSGQHPEP